MANTLATPQWTVNEVARYFANDVNFIANTNRTYDDQYEQAGAKVGNTVNARLPQRWTVTDGQALQPQAMLDQTVAITLTNQKNVAFGYSSAQATTEVDQVRKRYVQPAAEALGNAADVLAFQAVYRDIYSAVGVPGTTTSAVLDYLKAGTKLTDLATPMSGRVAMLDPLGMQSLVSAASTSFNPSGALSANWREAQFAANQLGVGAWFQDPNRPVHTTGTFTASTPLTNGASQSGSTVDIDGWASGASTLNKGDIFTIAGMNSVNPLSYQSTGRLQQFVVTATTSDVTGEMLTLPISPPMILTGALQTVDALCANNAVVTVLGATAAAGGTLATTTSPQGFIYHPDAFVFVMADLDRPTAGCECKVARSKQANLSIRWVEQYQIGTDQNPSRLDILIGAATLQARLACRIFG